MRRRSSPAVDLTPIPLGDAADARKRGRSSLAWAIRIAIARDGQAGRLGHRGQPGPQGAGHPERIRSVGPPTLHHYGTLIQTDAKLNLGTSGGPLLNLKGEMVGLSVTLAATAGYEAAGGYAIPVDQTFRRASRRSSRAARSNTASSAFSRRTLGAEDFRPRDSAEPGWNRFWPECRPAAHHGIKAGDVRRHGRRRPDRRTGRPGHRGRQEDEPVDAAVGLGIIRARRNWTSRSS